MGERVWRERCVCVLCTSPSLFAAFRYPCCVVPMSTCVCRLTEDTEQDELRLRGV